MTTEESTRRGVLAAGVTTVLALGGCTTGGGPGTDDTDGRSAGGPEATTGTTASTNRGPGAGTDGSNAFGETLRYDSAFAIDGTIESEMGEATITARIDGDDSYWRFERPDGRVTELYTVEGTDYVVSDERCLEGIERSLLPSGLTAQKFDADRTAHADVTPTGRGTLDGETVLRYEFDTGSESVTYEVDSESGYPRRVSAPSGTFTYHSWGAVDSIEPPQMACESIEGTPSV